MMPYRFRKQILSRKLCHDLIRDQYDHSIKKSLNKCPEKILLPIENTVATFDKILKDPNWP